MSLTIAAIHEHFLLSQLERIILSKIEEDKRRQLVDEITNTITSHFESYFEENTRKEIRKEILIEQLNSLSVRTNTLYEAINKYYKNGFALVEEHTEVEEYIEILTCILNLKQELEKYKILMERYQLPLIFRYNQVMAYRAIVDGVKAIGDNTEKEEYELEQCHRNIKAELANVSGTKYNIVLLGLAGIGKTSFVNYLCGTNLPTGRGESVTPGFMSVDIEISTDQDSKNSRKIKVRFIDSRGLEAGQDFAVWRKPLDEELSKRGIEKSVEEWLHAVMFFLSDNRISDVEIKLIDEFLSNDYNVIIILSKADLIKKDKIEKSIETIREVLGKSILQKHSELIKFMLGINFVEISLKNTRLLLEKLKLRNAQLYNEYTYKYGSLAIIPVANDTEDTLVTPFGIDEVRSEIAQNYWKSIVKRLPKRCSYLVSKLIDDWAIEVKKEINLMVANGTDGDKICLAMNDKAKAFIKNLVKEGGFLESTVDTEIKRAIIIYDAFSEALRYPPPAFNELTKIDSTLILRKYPLSFLKVMGRFVDAKRVWRNGFRDWYNEFSSEVDKYFKMSKVDAIYGELNALVKDINYKVSKDLDKKVSKILREISAY